jgi:hypothetical protein
MLAQRKWRVKKAEGLKVQSVGARGWGNGSWRAVACFQVAVTDRERKLLFVHVRDQVDVRGG